MVKRIHYRTTNVLCMNNIALLTGKILVKIDQGSAEKTRACTQQDALVAL